MHGELIWHPNVVAPDGSLGVYRYDFRPWDDFALDAVSLAFELLAAGMPSLGNNLAYYPVYESPRTGTSSISGQRAAQPAAARRRHPRPRGHRSHSKTWKRDEPTASGCVRRTRPARTTASTRPSPSPQSPNHSHSKPTRGRLAGRMVSAARCAAPALADPRTPRHQHRCSSSCRASR